MNLWQYESDGDNNGRTHYAIRETSDVCEVCGRFHGFIRLDFPDKARALEFVRTANAAIRAARSESEREFFQPKGDEQ